MVFRLDKVGNDTFQVWWNWENSFQADKIGKMFFRLNKIRKAVVRLGNYWKSSFQVWQNWKIWFQATGQLCSTPASGRDKLQVSKNNKSHGSLHCLLLLSCAVLIFGVEGIYPLAKCCHSCGPLLLEVGGQHGNASFSSSSSSLLNAVFNSGVEGSYLLLQLWPFVLESMGSAWEYLLLLLFLLLHLLHHLLLLLFLLLIRRGLYFWCRGQLFGGRNAFAVVAVCSWRLGSAARPPGWMALAPGRCPVPGEGRCQKERSSCSGAARKRPLFS